MSYDKIDKDKDKEQKDKGGMRERDERVICRSGSRQQQSQTKDKGVVGRDKSCSLLLHCSVMPPRNFVFYILSSLVSSLV